MKNFISYDGFEEIYELYLSFKSVNIYLEMRNFIEDDLYFLVGFMFIEFKVKGK